MLFFSYFSFIYNQPPLNLYFTADLNTYAQNFLSGIDNETLRQNRFKSYNFCGENNVGMDDQTFESSDGIIFKYAILYSNKKQLLDLANFIRKTFPEHFYDLFSNHPVDYSIEDELYNIFGERELTVEYKEDMEKYNESLKTNGYDDYTISVIHFSDLYDFPITPEYRDPNNKFFCLLEKINDMIKYSEVCKFIQNEKIDLRCDTMIRKEAEIFWMLFFA